MDVVICFICINFRPWDDVVVGIRFSVLVLEDLRGKRGPEGEQGLYFLVLGPVLLW